MNRTTARLITRLYPGAWRERYGDEFQAFLEAERSNILVWVNVAGSAVLEHIFPTVSGHQGGNMVQDPVSFNAIFRRPSAFLPLAMSAIALAMVLGYVARFGGGPVRDEGAVGHLWQLLMAGQMPIVAFFAIKWLPRAPRQTLVVLVEQAGAALASVAAVFLFKLG